MRTAVLAAALLCVLALPARAETCTASWYGGRHHGRLTASGERFNQNAMTAAMRGHRGRTVTVTNLANGRSVTVRINDYGPAAWTRRCIDLSYAASRAIGMDGLARVRVD